MKWIGTIKQWFSKPKQYPSETSKVRHLVLKYCEGHGCDIGFGGDKIKKENCVGIDLNTPYAYTGTDRVDIACDLNRGHIPVEDSTFDYVYSSHLIEDFADTAAVLREFIRILKPGGNLILVFPDQYKYEAYCKKHNQPINKSHVHEDMGSNYMKQTFSYLFVEYKIDSELLFISECEIDYNVILVIKSFKKIK